MIIQYFIDEQDESPPKDFLASLPGNVAARFYNYLRHLAEGGEMKGVAFKKLHDYPLEEIRVKQSRNLHRVILHVQVGKRIIVLHGFTKKEGSATPKKELDIAYQRLISILTKKS